MSIDPKPDESCAKTADDLSALLRKVHAMALAEAKQRVGRGIGDVSASDMAQSVARALLEYADRIEHRDGAPLRALMRKVLHDRIARELRRRRTQKRNAKLEVQVPDDSAVGELADRGQPNPVAEVAANELRERVHQRLLTMSETERQLLQMRIDGCSHAEIAQALGISEANSCKMLSRARQKLDDLLA